MSKAFNLLGTKVGSKCLHISRLQETTSKPKAVLAKVVQGRDFTKCK